MRCFKILGRDRNADLVSLPVARDWVTFPRLTYLIGEETMAPPDWAAAGFGLYVFRSRVAALPYYQSHRWMEDSPSEYGVHALELWLGDGERLEGACRYSTQEYTAYHRPYDGSPASLRQYIEDVQSGQGYDWSVSPIGESSEILATFTPRQHIPWSYGPVLASTEYTRESAQRGVEDRDNRIWSARRFVEQGYTGYNGRLTRIALGRTSEE